MFGFRFMLSCAFMALSWQVFAVNANRSPEEAAILPKYCEIDSPEARMRIYGPTFVATHHYCWAMLAMLRASRAADPHERAIHLSTVLGDLSYVIDNSPKTLVLLPEIYVKRGDFMRSNKKNEAAAIKDYYQAIQMKPSYAPAYLRLSDVYKKLGNIEEAKKILKQGLVVAPNTKSLQRKLSELK
jgi:tetratricopeptide (TPR) repeat protein